MAKSFEDIKKLVHDSFKKAYSVVEAVTQKRGSLELSMSQFSASREMAYDALKELCNDYDKLQKAVLIMRNADPNLVDHCLEKVGLDADEF
jgi:NACalpha-BTF3-like transcription factor